MTSRFQSEDNDSSMETSKKRRKSYLSIAVLILVLIVLLWYIHPVTVINAFMRISNNPLPIILFFILFSLAFGLRSLRWHLILGPSTSVPTLFRISLVTWFINAITPARLGDVSSVYLFHAEEEVPVARGILLVVIDRIMDVISLAVLFIVILNVVIKNSALGEVALFFLLFSLIVVLISFLVLFFLFNNPDRLQLLTHAVIGRVSSRLSNVISSTIQESNEELSKLARERKKILLAFVLAFPTWLLESTSTFLVAEALGITLYLPVAFVAAMVGFFSMTVPLTIGGFGSFELAIASSLVLLHSLDDKTALLIAFLDHVFRQVFVMGAGFVALLTFQRRIDDFLEKIFGQ